VINIIDYEFIPFKEIHTKFHIFEDTFKFKLTDSLEFHFLELPKIEHYKRNNKTEDKIVDWMEFLNANTKEEMEVLAKKMKILVKLIKC
jgi:hypothetical protein